MYSKYIMYREGNLTHFLHVDWLEFHTVYIIKLQSQSARTTFDKLSPTGYSRPNLRGSAHVTTNGWRLLRNFKMVKSQCVAKNKRLNLLPYTCTTLKALLLVHHHSIIIRLIINISTRQYSSRILWTFSFPKYSQGCKTHLVTTI